MLSMCSLGMTGVGNTRQNAVIVPNLEGITVEVATKILQTMGLQPQLQASSNLSAVVVRQDPQPGFSLPIGGKVLLSTGTQTGTTPELSGTRTLQHIPPASSQPRTVVGAISTSNVTGIPVTTTRTNVSAAPVQTFQQGSKVLAYSNVQGGYSNVLYQPPQPAVSQNFVADTTLRFYPAWYPRQFLNPVSPQGSGSQVQAGSMSVTGQPQVTSQSPVSPYGVSDTEPRSYLLWYPKTFLPQESSQDSVFVVQSDQPQQMKVLEVSTTSAVPVPNLSRLRREDAVVAIRKANLIVGNITQVQSSQMRPGIVINQSPRARAIVPAGTQVHLWIAN
jgi:beta-lactam-binding protein with PASTA domain